MGEEAAHRKDRSDYRCRPRHRPRRRTATGRRRSRRGGGGPRPRVEETAARRRRAAARPPRPPSTSPIRRGGRRRPAAARHARRRRRAGEQRGDRQQHRAAHQDDARPLAARDCGQSHRRIQHDPSGHRSDDRTRMGAHHCNVLGRRARRLAPPGRLRGQQGGAHRPGANGHARARAPRHHLQRDSARADRTETVQTMPAEIREAAQRTLPRAA